MAVDEALALSSFSRSLIREDCMSFAMTEIVVRLRYVIVVTIIRPPTKDHPRAMMVMLVLNFKLLESRNFVGQDPSTISSD